MLSPHRRLAAATPLWIAIGCSPSELPAQPCDATSTSTCLEPNLPAEAYIEQGLRYFDDLDSRPNPSTPLRYAPRVVRWEWPPWLLLTGYGAEMIEAADTFILAVQPGTTVPDRECRFFETQPFARCYVNFDYGGLRCPIYEEFTFDAEGRITFIEAWSDLPGLGPVDLDADPWAEGPDANRLSTRVPGLGIGVFDPQGAPMRQAAQTDPDLADLIARTEDFWGTWTQAFRAAGDALYEDGCGWPPGTGLP